MQCSNIEIYFSVVQRKVLTPNDSATLAALSTICSPCNIAIR